MTQVMKEHDEICRLFQDLLEHIDELIALDEEEVVNLLVTVHVVHVILTNGGTQNAYHATQMTAQLQILTMDMTFRLINSHGCSQ